MSLAGAARSGVTHPDSGLSDWQPAYSAALFSIPTIIEQTG
ncbi:TPA: hypothetical protein ACUU9M_000710 [Yersinia enterocolitica]|nr:hypothetical protein [Yersinia enterocolitica]UXD25223.1 hypothetical protein FORC065_2415 [Yersinia enterocolitica]UXD29282.1 hypothetical protein FORC066_2070 [Yersinia enterocolitica]UYJ95660.1 hypothetical protein N4W06_12080 [Yersinia enterocolitica]